jgi:hypothetical protein
MNLLTKLLTLLAALAELAGRWRKLKEQTEHEQEQRKLQDDPPGWFQGHFNSGRSPDADRVPEQPADLPPDADATGKTDAAKPDRK